MSGDTVSSVFQQTIKNYGNRVAATHKVGHEWVKVTWSELGTRVNLVSAGLTLLEIPVKARVGIISNTRLEWVVADLGVLGAGCTTVPIYQSSIADDVQYIINDADIVCLFAEDQSQVDKLYSIKEQITQVKRVICFEDIEDDGWVISWSEFCNKGQKLWEEDQASIESRVGEVSPHDLLTLIYTSGTTGRPKGVMITHDNMIYEAEAVDAIGIITPEDTQLLFLPLAHVFAKVLEVTWIKLAHEMAFAESITKVVENMKETKPTFMASVPRIFEKVYAKVVSKATATPGIKGKLARWAFKKEGWATELELAGQQPGGIRWKLAQKLVLSKVKASLKDTFGGRLKFFISGGAPLPADIAYFFKHHDVMILEGYGLTETSAATCVNRPDQLKIGTVGPVIPGTEVKIADDGEIMIKGRGVFQGYWNKEEATQEAIEPDGWFHSGDLGAFDGPFLKITGRKKDIIVTAGGKNIAPQNIESKIKSSCPLISQIVLHGDKRKYLTAVVTLDEAALSEWASSTGLKGDYATLTQSSEAFKMIDETIKTVNKALNSYETVKYFKILDTDFTVDSGELTPSLKVKRNVVSANYQEIFDGFYDA